MKQDSPFAWLSNRTVSHLVRAFLVIGVVLSPIAIRGEVKPMVYYVDATGGNDANDGRSLQNAWKKIARVNAASLLPGDTVLFKRGEIWREQLSPRSGDASARITYGAYGKGAKPLLLGSVAMTRPEDWVLEGSNVWTTRKAAWTPLHGADSLLLDQWHLHTEGGAGVTLHRQKKTGYQGRQAFSIQCVTSGNRGNHVQFYITNLHLEAGRTYTLSFRAKCTVPFRLVAIRLMKSAKPWPSYGQVYSPSSRITTEWQEHSIVFSSRETAEDGRITFFLGGSLPDHAELSFGALEFVECLGNQSALLRDDVGNLIFNQGQSCGTKVWKESDLDAQGKFWYDAAGWRVKLYSVQNPATFYSSIECALRRHIIDESGKSYITYESLGLRYGAAHGIGGSSTHHITVRNCDVSFIGGGHQHTRNGRPVRFGNGIEFWSNAHDNLVEGCRLWEIYDAALTNQGAGKNQQYNITYRNNVIWNCEYSFEYWNRGPESRTRDITFEPNTCVNAGHGWAHGQRPGPNGRHLMFYHNQARTERFVVRHNIFAEATESALRFCNDWSEALTMDGNCWYQPEGTLIQWLKQQYTMKQFAKYQSETGEDSHSVAETPHFLSPENLNFRLVPDSPLWKLFKGTEPVGALFPVGR